MWSRPGSVLVMACFARGLVMSPVALRRSPSIRLQTLRASQFSSDDDRLRAFEAQTGKRVFEALVEYPCDFQIRVIGREDETFVEDILGYIGSVTGTDKKEIKFSTTPSSKGTFISVSIEAPVDSANTLYECYSVLRQDPRVKVAL